MNNEHKISRRQVVGGIGAGLAAVAVSPVFGASTNNGSDTSQQI